MLACSATFCVAQMKAVPKTPFFIGVPDGFQFSNSFTGLESNEYGAFILFAELPVSLTEAKRGWTAENLKAKGMVLQKIEDQMINGDSTKCLFYISQVQSGVEYNKIVMLYGYGDNKLALISAGCPANNFENIQILLKNALLSILYNSEAEVPIADKLWFTLDMNTLPEFKLNNVFAGNAAIYSLNGKNLNEISLPAFYVVAKSTAPVGDVDKKQYILRIFKSQDLFNDVEVLSSKEIAIDGMNGFEVVGKGVYNSLGYHVSIYMVVVFSFENQYHRFLGVSPIDYDQADRYRSITKTFSRK
jgi:hypothetical protein